MGDLGAALQRGRNIAAAVAIIVAFGCTKVQTGSVHAGGGNPWTRHGVLRMAGLSEPDNLDPLVGNQQIEADLSMFWAAYLFRWSDRNELVPELATAVPSLANGGISKDGLSITYHLRSGVKWQDGAPFGADDVVYTWRQVMNPRNNVASRSGYDLIVRIDETDDHTIVVRLKKPYAPFVSTFFTMSSVVYCILPKHLLERYPDLNRVPYNDKPIGTGPYRVVEYEKGSLIKFVAYPGYWRGPPKIKEIDYRIVPDENTILTQLRSHEADFEFAAPPAQAPSLTHIPGTTYRLTPFTSYAQLAFNLDNTILKDVVVRRALSYATDRQAIIQKANHGISILGDTDQPSFLWTHNDRVTKYPYDPHKARALFEAAGWTTGPDGVRVKDGARLQLVMVGTTGSAVINAVEPILQQQWRGVGVDLELKNYATPIMFASYGAGGILQRGKFDVGFYGWVNGVDPDDATLFTCDQFPPAGQNIYHFCDPALDAAERVALAEYDRAKRKAAYDRIQSILADRQPFILLWFNRRLDVFNTDFKNYRPAHAVTTLWNPWEWEI